MSDKLLVVALVVLSVPATAHGEPLTPPPTTHEEASVIFQGVRIFDGTGGPLSAPSNVLIRGNRIVKISTAPIPVQPGDNTITLPGAGRVLMPGLVGVIQEGGQADLLVVNGDPIANIKLVENPSRNVLVIMKDGKVYKNVLATAPGADRPAPARTAPAELSVGDP